MIRSFTLLACAIFVAGLAACVPAGEDKNADRPKPKDTGVEEGTPDAGEVLDTGAMIDAGAEMDASIQDVPDAALPEPDMDQDGIPDSEDPAPNHPDPSLIVDPFGEASTGWLFSSVSMSIDSVNGVLRANVLEPFVREGWIGPRPSWADYYMRSSIRVLSVGTSSDPSTGRAGIMARVNQVSPDRYLFCALDFKENIIVLTEHDGGGPDGTELARAPITTALGEWVPVRMLLRGTIVSCTIDGVEVSGVSATFTYGAIGFRAFDATFEADFVEAYDL